VGNRDRGVRVFGIYPYVDMVSPRRALADYTRMCLTPAIVNCNFPTCPRHEHDDADDDGDDNDGGDEDDDDDDGSGSNQVL
jgi:hypothetical protein